MMMMTAKLNVKKLFIALAVIVGLIIALVITFGNHATEPTAVVTMASNDSRIAFLKQQGWDVTTSPVESNQVRIPKEMTPVYERYNALQKTQGFDLSQYAGKSAMRYVYQINNYPGATEPVYATLLVYKDQIIGGDITNTATNGSIQGVITNPQSPSTEPAETPSAPSSAAATAQIID